MPQTTTYDWHEHVLQAQLARLLPGLSVEVQAAVGSTNTTLLDRLRFGSTSPVQQRNPPLRGEVQVRQSVESHAFNRRAWDVEPVLLIAEHQTAGRGRNDRPWHGAIGSSLTFSLALPYEPPSWSGLSLAVGVAIAEALDPVPAGGAPHIGLKWPNDLWLIDPSAPLHGRKLAGILIETVTAANRRLAVIGIGINVLPVESPGLDTGIASVSERQPGVTPPIVLSRIALPLVEALTRFQHEGYAPFAARFDARDLLRGRAVTLSQGEVRAGVARGVGEDGTLQVEAGGALVSVHSGEVSVRPAPEAPPC